MVCLSIHLPTQLLGDGSGQGRKANLSMTVAISIKVHDGLVLASDSAATIFGSDGNGGLVPVNVYNNANKVFNLHRGLGIGGMVWGAGSIGHASIATLAKDLRVRLEGRDQRYRRWEIDPSDYTIQHVAELTRQFLFEEHYQHHYRKESDRTKKPSFGFMVAGYSSGVDLAEEWAACRGRGGLPRGNAYSAAQRLRLGSVWRKRANRSAFAWIRSPARRGAWRGSCWEYRASPSTHGFDTAEIGGKASSAADADSGCYRLGEESGSLVQHVLPFPRRGERCRWTDRGCRDYQARRFQVDHTEVLLLQRSQSAKGGFP